MFCVESKVWSWKAFAIATIGNALDVVDGKGVKMTVGEWGMRRHDHGKRSMVLSGICTLREIDGTLPV